MLFVGWLSESTIFGMLPVRIYNVKFSLLRSRKGGSYHLILFLPLKDL